MEKIKKETRDEFVMISHPTELPIDYYITSDGKEFRNNKEKAEQHQESLNIISKYEEIKAIKYCLNSQDDKFVYFIYFDNEQELKEICEVFFSKKAFEEAKAQGVIAKTWYLVQWDSITDSDEEFILVDKFLMLLEEDIKNVKDILKKTM